MGLPIGNTLASALDVPRGARTLSGDNRHSARVRLGLRGTWRPAHAAGNGTGERALQCERAECRSPQCELSSIWPAVAVPARRRLLADVRGCGRGPDGDQPVTGGARGSARAAARRMSACAKPELPARLGARLHRGVFFARAAECGHPSPRPPGRVAACGITRGTARGALRAPLKMIVRKGLTTVRRWKVDSRTTSGRM